MDPEPYIFTLELDRDNTQMIRLDLKLVPYNCLVIGPVSLCDLSGTLTDQGQEYSVSGRRRLVDGQGGVWLEFTFKNLRFKYIGRYYDPTDFEGKFLCLSPEGIGAVKSSAVVFNPGEGDTGTGTGNQTLLESDEQTQTKAQEE